MEKPTFAPVAVRAAVTTNPWRSIISRPVLAVVTVVALGAATYWIPGLERARLFSLPVEPGAPRPIGVAPPKLVVGEATLETETRTGPEIDTSGHAQPPGARGPIAKKAAEALPPIDVKRPPVPIVDATGKALDGFYAALDATERSAKGAITRIVHFGDSIVVSDYVSGTLRRKMQAEFGDAGHGYVLLANAWPAYRHNDVYRFASAGWLVSRIVGPLAPDGLYGLGGVSFRAPPGSRARFGTAKAGTYGRAVSKFVISYLRQPGGGSMRISVDGKEVKVLSTAGDEKEVTEEVVRVDDGAHELEIATIDGYSRGFGVVMERDTPGVVLDAIGIQGARIRFLDKQDDAHWKQQLEWRKPDLLIYQFGANESGDGFAYPMDQYHQTMVQVLEQGRDALPNAGCLVLAAMDRAEKKGGGLRSMAVIPAIVAEQKKAAADAGCAFWNTYEAMGGAGSMPAWVARGLGQADLTHPTGAGSGVIASWIFRALVGGLNDYRRRQTR